ncbi:MAG TPA: PRC-barrel domain-containing protein [Candidatus Bathyarchaeia archaeon]
MNAKEIFGKEVIGDQGSRIGKVRDLIFDVGTWQIRELEVDLVPDFAEELGLKRMLGSTPAVVKVDYIRGVSDTITLKISRPQLREAIQGKPPTQKEEVQEA